MRTDPWREASLVIEPTTGVVVIDGEHFQLTPKMFALFLELARTPGKAVSTDSLVQHLYPDVPGIVSQDVYKHVYRLRKRIGDTRRTPRLIAQRPGFGYLIDRDPEQVSMVDGPMPVTASNEEAMVPDENLERTAVEAPVSVQDLTPAQDPLSSDEKPVPIELLDGEPSAAADTRPKRELPRRTLVAAISALVLSAIIGTALLSRALGDPERAESPTPSDRTAAQEPRREVKPPEVRGRRQHRKTPANKGRKHRRPQGGQVFAATAPPDGGTVTSGGSSAPSQPEEVTEPKRDPKPAPPPLPPAPSSYLYHLFNPETGDHFMTVNPGVASEYEGRGYNSAAIGRVYDYAEKDAKAITTNSGTAYVFASSSPQTSPGSNALALWYASDSSGDFFYTTTKNEASKDGWSASLIGYVRSP
jgi:DNA-binding winged helix-turn-helix (wHTH) protein